MTTQNPEQQLAVQAADRPELPAYEPPSVTCFTDEELLEALGPGHAGPAYVG